MKKILIVDDEEAICNMLKKYLDIKGYSVLIVNKAEEVLPAVKDQKPDAVLLDIIMPGMNGVELLSKIKSENSMIGVIMMTAVKDGEVARRCLDMGAADYITKPFSLSYLEKSLLLKLDNIK